MPFLIIWAAACQNQQNDVFPANTQFSLSAWRNLGSLATYTAHSQNSDQTGWVLGLIWVFAERTGHFVGFVMLWLICLAQSSISTAFNTGQVIVFLDIFNKQIFLW